jgi:hypothetical protein
MPALNCALTTALHFGSSPTTTTAGPPCIPTFTHNPFQPLALSDPFFCTSAEPGGCARLFAALVPAAPISSKLSETVFAAGRLLV